MGKKKKSLASRLARMSDEERARYLQKKSDQEEELKRRREQLLSTFMKKKLKREDDFARINESKLNEFWHKFLRKRKIDEMRIDVRLLSKWFRHVFLIKNRTISKRLEELERVEDIYGLNLRTHSSHIDKMIELHVQHLEKLKKNYNYDKKYILTDGDLELNSYKIQSENRLIYSKTISFIQKEYNKKYMQEENEQYLCKKLDLITNNHCELEVLEKNRKHIMGEIWKGIFVCLHTYVHREDKKRYHYSELKKIDRENGLERVKNECLIEKLQEKLNNMQQFFKLINTDNDKRIDFLKGEIDNKKSNLLQLRKNSLKLQKEDAKILVDLTVKSNESIDYLEKIDKKLDQLLVLINNCKKFQEESDLLIKYMQLFEDEQDLDEEIQRPKTAAFPLKISARYVKKLAKPRVKSALEVKYCQKVFENVKEMEHFWIGYNKVKVEVIEGKLQRKRLEEENRESKEILREILEKFAFKSTIPNPKICAPQRLIVSAPASTNFRKILEEL